MLFLRMVEGFLMRRPFVDWNARSWALDGFDCSINTPRVSTVTLGSLAIVFAIGIVPCRAQAGLPRATTTVAVADEPAEIVKETDLELAGDELAPVPTESAATIDRRETLLASLTIFVLAVFLGFELITKVPPTLHTPLMSGSNAISGITLVGALLVAGARTDQTLIPLLGCLAVVMATVNAVGGFAVTHRMLAMFRRK